MTEAKQPNNSNLSFPKSKRRQTKVVQKAFLPIDPDHLAIGGDDADNPEGDVAELRDVTNGQHFLYFFSEEVSPIGHSSTDATDFPELEKQIQAGITYFARRFKGYHAQAVILSASYGCPADQLLAGLQVIELPEIPPGHFWFGPKPSFYQLSFFQDD